LRDLGSAVFIITLLAFHLPVASAQGGDSISATGDAALATLKTQRGWTGSGTASSPYVITGYDLLAVDAHGISLTNTRAHVVIRDVSIAAGGAKWDAIRLVNATNVTIERADLQFNRAGVVLQAAHGVTIRDSTIRASKSGITLENTDHAKITANNLAVNEQNVAFTTTGTARTSGNVFRENNLSIATGQYGFFFQGPHVYNNDVDPSNVVNFVPVRWHTNVAGTAATPHVFTGEAAHVKGMTNVGQVACISCSHVRFENVNASSGAANGLVIEKSHNVTIHQAFAEGNDAAGIHVRNSTRVDVTSSSAYANKIGIHGFNASNMTVSGVTLAANDQGMLLNFGGINVVRESSVESNREGVFLDRTNRTTLETTTVARNTADGIRLAAGRDNAAQSMSLRDNKGAGINVVGTFNATVSASRAENNSAGGILLGKDTLLAKVTGNTVVGNGEGGIRLVSTAALNRIEDNTLENQSRHIRFTMSGQAVVSGNTMTAGPNQTGLWFDDEASYNNEISTTNLVGGTPVQWHVALVGSPSAPIVLRGMRVEAENVTNVAQIMVYKTSYVRVEDAIAANGARGIYGLRSSSITITDSTVRDNQVGIELRGTQTGEVRRVSAYGGKSGVLLAETLNISVSDLTANGTRIAVEFADTKSRGAVVERIDASGVTEVSVKDPTAATTEPRHLIADAGLDKRAPVGANVTFSDALGVARFGSERILRQSWDFGDAGTVESEATATLRPTHIYEAAGDYVATYVVETADGLRLSDTVEVRVIAPPPAPTNLTAQIVGGKVNLSWLPPESEFPITSYRVYRGIAEDNLTFLMEGPKNETVATEKMDTAAKIWYSVTAIAFGGESLNSTLATLTITPPPPPPPTPIEGEEVPGEGEEAAQTPLPAVALLALAAGLAAVARRRRG
jgi:nitrous oxidase accessory protein NosD